MVLFQFMVSTVPMNTLQRQLSQRIVISTKGDSMGLYGAQQFSNTIASVLTSE